MDSYNVDIHYDIESSLWYSTSKDIPGFSAGGSSVDELLLESKLTISDLLEMNDFKVHFNMDYEDEVHYG
jgi:hypothetical protein